MGCSKNSWFSDFWRMILSYKDVSFPPSECTARHWKSARPAKNKKIRRTSSIHLFFFTSVFLIMRCSNHMITGSIIETTIWNNIPYLEICMLFLWLRVCPCGSQHRWDPFFGPAAALWGGGCLRGSGFHRESDRKGPEVCNAAQGVCWGERRSTGSTGNTEMCQIRAMTRAKML